jgi:transposase-like protein
MASHTAGQTPTQDGTPTSSQSYRDIEELLAERGVEVDHVTVYRWVQRFTPLLTDAAKPCRTWWEIAGRWTRPT